MKPIFLLLLAGACSVAVAKLPAPSDEAKAKAAETAAKTAHGNKVADYQLCRSREKVAEHYRTQLKKAGKDAPAATETPACADPGTFVYTPPSAASGASAPATAAAPAAPASAAKKT